MQSIAELFAILPYPRIDPVAFWAGPVPIHWYGLAYVAGILFGWVYARSLVSNDRIWPEGASRPTKTQLDDFIVWVAIGIVFGGRIGYILFYDLEKFLADPISMVQIWNGGMSFHGGMIGTIIAMALFARKNKVRVLTMFDIVAAVAPIGLFFGRLANFINGELWGRISDVPWAMVFPTGGPFSRHPSQLYEAGLEGIALFLILCILTYGFKALKNPGTISGVFVIGYAFARIFVEFFREPDAQLGYLLGTNWLTMGMILSTPMIAIGAGLVIYAQRATARHAS